MCRAKTATPNGIEGRRCPCDTSENRNLRRHNQNGISRHEDQRTVKFEAAETSVAAPAPSPTLTFEQQKEALVAEAKQHAADAKKFMEPDGYNPRAAEASTRKAGAALQTLSDLIAGKPYAEEVAAVQDGIAAARVEEEEAEKALVAIRNERDNVIHEEFVKKMDMMDAGMAWTPADEAAYRARVAFIKSDYMERVEAGVAKKVEAMNKVRNLTNGPEANEVKDRHRNAVIEAIGTVRELGGDVEVASNSDRKAAQALKDTAGAIYPKEWIEASNRDRPERLRVKKTTGRAHYTSSATQVGRKKMDAYVRSDWAHEVAEAQTPGTRLHAVGTVVIQPGETWAHPESGKVYDNTYGDKPEIVKPVVTWAGSGFGQPRVGVTEDAPKPSGTGWKEARVDEGAGYLVTRWYKSEKTPQEVSRETQAELTVSGFDHSNSEREIRRIAVHEFAHRVEATPDVGRKLFVHQNKFLERRTTNEAGEREKTTSISPGVRGRGNEVGYKDGFVSHYIGRIYNEGTHREVLSVGAEAVFGDGQNSLMGWDGKDKGDKDMRDFIIGLWATA